MAQRFPHQFLSVVSSQESGSKPPASPLGEERQPPTPPSRLRQPAFPPPPPVNSAGSLRREPMMPAYSQPHLIQPPSPSSNISKPRLDGRNLAPLTPKGKRSVDPRSRFPRNSGDSRPITPTRLPTKPQGKRGTSAPRVPDFELNPPPTPGLSRTREDSRRPIPPPPQSPLPRKRRVVKRRAASPLIYLTRLLILGIGIAVISGTVLSVLNSLGGRDVAQSAPTEATTQVKQPPVPPLLAVPLAQEMTPLKTKIEGLAAQYTGLTPGVFLVDLDTGNYVDINGAQNFAAASTIKVPILVAFFQAIDQGKIHLDEKLTMNREQIAEGSGEMQYRSPGSKFTALETITKMITISDNTATNMVIDRLGGAEGLNQQFQTWGLANTVIHNRLPDLPGTNTTSPKDLVGLISQVNQGELVSMKSRDRLLGIMEQTRNESLLPSGLGEGAIIAHKTGNIDEMLADAGMVDMPNGKRYLIAVMVKHPQEQEGNARSFIRQVSEMVYQDLSPSAAAMPEKGAAATP